MIVYLFIYLCLYIVTFLKRIYITRVYGNDHFGHNKSLELIIFHLLRER